MAGALVLMLLIAACSSPLPPAADLAPSVEEPETDTEATETGTSDLGTAPDNSVVDTSRYDEFEIITLLPPDAIPAIDNPAFLTADEADDFYDPEELVMGVVFNGDARAYSVPHLSRHEIVNDEVGGVKIAVTW